MPNSKNKNTDIQKKCNSCRQMIDTSATTCQHCGQRQSFLGKYFGDIAVLISVVMVILAIGQFLDARKKNIDASKALATAQTAVDQLQKLACINAEAALTDSMSANFMGGVDFKTRLAYDHKIIDSLIEMGISEENIKNAKTTWSKGVGVIYHRGICDTLEGRTNPQIININATPELKAVVKELKQMANFNKWEVPSPDKMEAFIKKKEYMNDALKDLISDYRYFLETSNIQRRSVFEQL